MTECPFQLQEQESDQRREKACHSKYGSSFFLFSGMFMTQKSGRSGLGNTGVGVRSNGKDFLRHFRHSFVGKVSHRENYN